MTTRCHAKNSFCVCVTVTLTQVDNLYLLCNVHDNCNLIWRQGPEWVIGPFVRVPAPTQTSLEGDVKFVLSFSVKFVANFQFHHHHHVWSIKFKTKKIEHYATFLSPTSIFCTHPNFCIHPNFLPPYPPPTKRKGEKI